MLSLAEPCIGGADHGIGFECSVEIVEEKESVEEEPPVLEDTKVVVEEGVAPSTSGSMSLSSIILSFFMENFSVLWAFINSAQMLYLIPVHNVGVPEAAKELFKAFGSSFYPIPSFLEGDGGESPPSPWSRYDFDTQTSCRIRQKFSSWAYWSCSCFLLYRSASLRLSGGPKYQSS